MSTPETGTGPACPNQARALERVYDTANPFPGFDDEQVRLATQASEVFLAAFDPKGEYIAGYLQVPENALAQTVACDGVAKVATGFRLLRQAMGEEPYTGMSIEPSDSTERTTPDEYLNLIRQKKLIINRWENSHDERNHLAGGLIATGEVAEILMLAAGFALDLPLTEKTKEEIAQDIDFATSYIRLMWLERAAAGLHIHGLGSKIIDMYKRAGVPFDDKDARSAASRQNDAIRNWFYRAGLLSQTHTASQPE